METQLNNMDNDRLPKHPIRCRINEYTTERIVLRDKRIDPTYIRFFPRLHQSKRKISLERISYKLLSRGNKKTMKSINLLNKYL
jgi:hypothetical protein